MGIVLLKQKYFAIKIACIREQLIRFIQGKLRSDLSVGFTEILKGMDY
jgi:hypothetical protein